MDDDAVPRREALVAEEALATEQLYLHPSAACVAKETTGVSPRVVGEVQLELGVGWSEGVRLLPDSRWSSADAGTICVDGLFFLFFVLRLSGTNDWLLRIRLGVLRT